MAHYRHGRKVPALPPPQRHAVGVATVAAVFVLVALTSWKPAVFGIPSLVVIGCLGILDYAVVMTRPEPRATLGRDHGRRDGGRRDGGRRDQGRDAGADDAASEPGPGTRRARRAARAGLPAADGGWYADLGYDQGGSATTMLPRMPMDADDSFVAPPTAAIARPTSAPAAAAGHRRDKPLHPAYARTFSPEEDVLSWDDRDGEHHDESREDALLHTMAVDMRGLLNETGVYRI